jgi:hypothetical protein
MWRQTVNALRPGSFTPEVKTARMSDAETGREIAVLTGHKGIVWGAGFSPDGTRVVTASYDRTAASGIRWHVGIEPRLACISRLRSAGPSELPYLGAFFTPAELD